MNRYFWCLSDNKTVREISWDEFKEMNKADYRGKNTRRLIWVGTAEIYLSKGKRGMWIRLEQLMKVLELAEKEEGA